MVRLRFETDLATSLKASQDLAKATEKVANSYTKTAKEAKALEAAARRIVESNETPLERYSRKIERLAELQKAGKLTTEQASRAATKYAADLERLRTGFVSLEAVERSAKEVTKQRTLELQKSAQAQDGAFGARALGNIKSYLAGLVSMSGAIALFRSEMEAVKAEAEKIAQSQLTAAGARDVLKRNIAPLGLDKARKFEARADALSGELGISQRHVDIALASAMGASGGNVDQAFRQVRVAGQFLKTSPEGIGEFAGALGDVAKSTGDKNALRNLGFLITVGAESRVTDDRKLAGTLPAALAGAVTYGATPEEGGALFDALSAAAADTEGRLTRTGVVRSTEQLAEFFDKKVKSRKFQAAAVDTFGERMAVLRADPAIAREFADTASFEAAVKGPLRQFFLDPTSDIAREYERLRPSFGTPSQQITKAKEQIAYLDEGRTAATAATERTIAARTEQFMLGQDAQLTQESRDAIINRNARLRGSSFSTSRFRTMMSTGFTMSPEEAIQQLEEGLIISAQAGPSRREEQKELVENTRAMVEELKAIRQQQQGAPRPSGRQE